MCVWKKKVHFFTRLILPCSLPNKMFGLVSILYLRGIDSGFIPQRAFAI